MPWKLKWLICCYNEVLWSWRSPSPLETGWEARAPHLQGPSGLGCDFRILIFVSTFNWGIYDFAQINITFGYFLSKTNQSGKLLVIFQNENELG